MYGNKKVTLLAIGLVGALLQGEICIFVACIYDLDVLAVFLDILAHFEGHGKVDVLFTHIVVNGAMVHSTVAGVYHNHIFIGSRHYCATQHTEHKQSKESEGYIVKSCSFHIAIWIAKLTKKSGLLNAGALF